MPDKLDEYSKEFIKHMGRSLFEGLEDAIPKILETFVEQRFKGIVTALEPVSRIEAKQLEQDKIIENLQVSYNKMELDMSKLRENNHDLPKDVKEAAREGVREEVASAVAEAVPQAVDDTFDVNKLGRKITVEKKNNKRWFQFWKRGAK